LLLVLERKEDDVQKVLQVLTQCVRERKLSKASLRQGLLGEPLELLRDIEIDAPLASALLAHVIADWMHDGFLDVSFLLDASEYVRTQGRPASLAAQVFHQRIVRGYSKEPPTDAEDDFVAQLLSTSVTKDRVCPWKICAY
jgi:MA3 domain